MSDSDEITVVINDDILALGAELSTKLYKEYPALHTDPVFVVQMVYALIHVAACMVCLGFRRPEHYLRMIFLSFLDRIPDFVKATTPRSS